MAEICDDEDKFRMVNAVHFFLFFDVVYEGREYLYELLF